MSTTNHALAEPPAPGTTDNPFEARAVAPPVAAASLLNGVTTGRRLRPLFALIYGLPGIGKTSFAAGAPFPIFIPTERGTDQLDVARFPRPETYEEFINQLDTIQFEKHDYKTLVVDTLDSLETLIWEKVVKEYKCKSIEDPGYGKGFNRAKEIWKDVLEQLTAISERIHVLMLAHATVKAFSDPALTVPYDTWALAVHPKSADIIKGAVDTMLFASIKVEIQKDGVKAKKGRGIMSEERTLITQPTTGLDCKNRFNLEPELPLKWEALGSAVKAFYTNK